VEEFHLVVLVLITLDLQVGFDILILPLGLAVGLRVESSGQVTPYFEVETESRPEVARKHAALVRYDFSWYSEVFNLIRKE
jgi:hypothetical protein